MNLRLIYISSFIFCLEKCIGCNQRGAKFYEALDMKTYCQQCFPSIKMIRIRVKKLCLDAKKLLFKNLAHNSEYLCALEVEFLKAQDDYKGKQIQELMKQFKDFYNSYQPFWPNIEQKLSDGNAKLAFDLCIDNLNLQLQLGKIVKGNNFAQCNVIDRYLKLYEKLYRVRSVNSMTNNWTLDHFKGLRQVDIKDKIFGKQMKSQSNPVFDYQNNQIEKLQKVINTKDSTLIYKIFDHQIHIFSEISDNQIVKQYKYIYKIKDAIKFNKGILVYTEFQIDLYYRDCKVASVKNMFSGINDKNKQLVKVNPNHFAFVSLQNYKSKEILIQLFKVKMPKTHSDNIESFSQNCQISFYEKSIKFNHKSISPIMKVFSLKQNHLLISSCQGIVEIKICVNKVKSKAKLIRFTNLKMNNYLNSKYTLMRQEDNKVLLLGNKNHSQELININKQSYKLMNQNYEGELSDFREVVKYTRISKYEPIILRFLNTLILLNTYNGMLEQKYFNQRTFGDYCHEETRHRIYGYLEQWSSSKQICIVNCRDGAKAILYSHLNKEFIRVY